MPGKNCGKIFGGIHDWISEKILGGVSGIFLWGMSQKCFLQFPGEVLGWIRREANGGTLGGIPERIVRRMPKEIFWWMIEEATGWLWTTVINLQNKSLISKPQDYFHVQS